MIIDTLHFRPLFRPALVDLFNYESRTTKRLIRRTLSLAKRIGKNKRIENDALTLEVWVACVVPVMWGFKRSQVTETRQSGVSVRYSQLMLDFVTHDLVMDTPRIQFMSTNDKVFLLDKVSATLRQTLQQRSDEYVPEIANFLVRGRSENFRSTQLTISLIRHLFGDLVSEDDSNLQSSIMTDVALPMITAFEKSLES